MHPKGEIVVIGAKDANKDAIVPRAGRGVEELWKKKEKKGGKKRRWEDHVEP